MDSIDLRVKEIVEHSYTVLDDKRINGKRFRSYNAGCKADLFAEFSKTNRDLAVACWRYGELLNQRLKEISNDENIINMSVEHICDETFAHLLIWFRWSKKLGFGISYKACEVVDLNIDENRFPIKQFIALVGYYRKRLLKDRKK